MSDPILAIDLRWVRSAQLDGIGRYTLELTAAILQNKNLRLKPLLLCQNRDFIPDWFWSIAKDADAAVHLLDFPVLSIADGLKLAKHLTGLKVSCFFSPHALTMGFGKSFRTVLTVHDLIPMLFSEVRSTWKWRLFFGWRLPLSTILSRASQIIAISHQTRRDLISRLGIPDSKINVIYNGINQSFGQHLTPDFIAAIRTKFNLPEHFVLCVSRQENYKNLAALLKAYEGLGPVVHRHLKLVVVGPEHALHKVEHAARAKALVAAKKLLVLGYVTDAELQGLYQSATMFCLPSIYEGFGLPVLEAMASGCPVVCSNTAALPEVAGEAAIYFDPKRVDSIKNAIQKLWIDELLRKKLKTLGIEQAKKFSWQKTATEVIALLNADQ
jgi:glycosyltransferase involved in cell wall biosynthesis